MNEERVIDQLMELLSSIESSLRRIADAVENPTPKIDENGDRI